MIGWIILAAYVIGWAGFSVTIARFLESDVPSDTAGDRALVVTLGMIAAMFWPLVVPGGWVYKKVFAPKKDES